MHVFAKLALSGMLLLTGCSKASEGTARPEPSGAASGAAEQAQPLSAQLGAAVSAKVYAVAIGANGAERNVAATLDEAATKAYLGGLDLSQRADGPVAKCPSDKLVEFANAKGEVVGTIGFCEGKAASFILPNGVTVGGINATAP